MTVSAKGVKEAACNSRSAPKVCTQFADCGFVTAAGCGARCFACVLLLLLLLLLFTFFFFCRCPSLLDRFVTKKTLYQISSTAVQSRRPVLSRIGGLKCRRINPLVAAVVFLIAMWRVRPNLTELVRL